MDTSHSDLTGKVSYYHDWEKSNGNYITKHVHLIRDISSFIYAETINWSRIPYIYLLRFRWLRNVCM